MYTGQVTISCPATAKPMDTPDKIGQLEPSINIVRLESRDEDRKADARLSSIEASLPGLSTKADLQEMKADLIKWIIGTEIGLGATAITVMTFVLNHATPRAATAAAPIIMQLPVPAATLAPAAPTPGRN